MSVRLSATRVLTAILKHEGSLATSLPVQLEKLPESEHSLLRQLCYGSMRYYPQLQLLAEQLIPKPLKRKDLDVQALVLLGLYQLAHLRIPAHAAISETVQVTAKLKKPWAKALVNGVLRNFQRQQAVLDEQLSVRQEFSRAHPKWLIKALRQAWPEQANEIMAQNNAQAPMSLRVNRLRGNRDDYAQQLQQAGIDFELCRFSSDGITLAQPKDVNQLPGFSEGLVSVQDEAAQLAAALLAPEPGERILDACAAPGGKTCHLLERQPELSHCLALDMSELRLGRVRQNLDRLALDCELLRADAAAADWWDGQPFDRILLDAPCSATGVIRRNPDIKYLRQAKDIATLAHLQGQILRNLWPMLKPGGRLLYATCSVLPQENAEQISAFLADQADARELPLEADWGIACSAGRQLFAQPGGHDGFYYALLEKGSA
ncbi:16S rRNA (cytosine(967)-C(5))-methyltransferase RsmB [Motiliproteus sp.]|uniref:16S rRNA (cytosine(967)-C(5))-methyltransferase RsmB n=1 Tax=Motiliproteus sp. TaxID=1898955 RepID=UPI003BAD522D